MFKTTSSVKELLLDARVYHLEFRWNDSDVQRGFQVRNVIEQSVRYIRFEIIRCGPTPDI